jgi:branched-chain amino acid transport system permease protein
MTTAIISGLATGSIYALIAIGYNITYLSAGALNFAQANLVVLGAFLTAWCYQHGWAAYAIYPAVGVAVAVIAMLEERLAIRPLRNRGSHSELVTTLGAATIITGTIIVIWGSDPIEVTSFGANSPFSILGGRAQPIDFILMGCAVGVAALLVLLVRRTSFGIATLAQSEDADAASLRGIDVRRLSLYGFGLAGLLAGLMSPIVGNKTYAVASVSLLLAVKGFVALTFGGLGSIEGALIGGLCIGVIESLAARYVGADYRDIALFLVFAATLLVRPQGLFGKPHLRPV